jgi:hypothetical protein
MELAEAQVLLAEMAVVVSIHRVAPKAQAVMVALLL